MKDQKQPTKAEQEEIDKTAKNIVDGYLGDLPTNKKTN
jgi:hypothetical protein